MKKLLIAILYMSFAFPLLGQQFIASDTIRMDGSRQMAIRWADWNGNQSPDLIVANKMETSLQVSLIVRQNGSWIPQLLDIHPSQLLFELADMNNDGLLDFIGVSDGGGQRNLVIELQGSNGFESVPLIPVDSLISLAVFDLNQDGLKDLIAGGIYDNRNFNALILNSKETPDVMNFSPDTVFHTVSWGNFYSPSQKNILFAGEYGLFSGTFKEGSLTLTQRLDTPVESLTSADLIMDSLDESLIVSSDNPDKLRWFSPAVDSTLFPAGTGSTRFVADLTSDGQADIWQLREDGTGQLWMQGQDTGFEPVFTLPVLASAVAFGDQENDGDLDIAVLSRENKELIHLFTNTADTNRGPSLPPYHVAFEVNNEIFIAWAASTDDHTIISQITYDVIIGKNPTDATFRSGAFDLDEARRMYWVRGNSGLQNEATITDLQDGLYYYGIQSLDNARFPVFPDGPGSGCEYPLPIALGAFEAGAPLPPVTHLPFCDQDSITLSSTGLSGWYSAENGFLGMSDRVRFKAVAGDTIYQKPVSYNSCEINPVQPVVFVLTESEDISTSSDIWGCEEELVTLKTFPGGDSTRWINSSLEMVWEGLEFNYELTRNDTILAHTYFNGCVKTDSFFLFISKPDVQADPNSVVVFKGNSVSLSVSGAESYAWYPPDYLDDAFTANPVATPPASIIYTVIGTDSLSCTDSATVNIEVQDQAFIPNLFTPNGDLHNDRLLIYGLSPVTSFTFTIYNRNGATVFSTNDPGELTASGWDGTKNGEPQPDGVYYWKVDGRYNNDDPVLLNGKNEGVIHLMR